MCSWSRWAAAEETHVQLSNSYTVKESSWYSQTRTPVATHRPCVYIYISLSLFLLSGFFYGRLRCFIEIEAL
jgi:hypothetical protein